MKTLNCHPVWRNQPLLLSPAQTENPNLVLTDFFQSYHLRDVREIMWQWMTEAVSGPNSHSIDHHDRNNYLFFYEKIEALVEAAWTMNRSGQPVANPAKQLKTDTANKPVQTPEKAIQTTRFSKPARLIEKATTQPVEVITEVFDQVTLNDLTEYLLPNWFQVAIVNSQSPYSNGNGRETLYEFFELLFQFVEELHALWTNQQLTNLSPTITDFFRQCSIDYLRRELADFLEAGIGHNGAYPNGFSPWQAWMVCDQIQCLAEASYQLYINQHMQSVTIRLYSPRNQ
jgi:hypothetical protein